MTLELLARQEQRLTEVLGVVTAETTRVARAVDQAVRADYRR